MEWLAVLGALGAFLGTGGIGGAIVAIRKIELERINRKAEIEAAKIKAEKEVQEAKHKAEIEAQKTRVELSAMTEKTTLNLIEALSKQRLIEAQEHEKCEKEKDVLEDEIEVLKGKNMILRSILRTQGIAIPDGV